MQLNKKNIDVLKKMSAAHGVNVLSLPRVEKVVLNVGVGDYKDNREELLAIEREIAQITSQKPRATRAKTSISSFKTRKGEKIGFSVTLRAKRMWDFLDRLINIILPGIRDFVGISRKSFDASNNLTIGMKEQTLFPEIDPNQIKMTWGVAITFVLRNARDRNLVEEYLKGIGIILN
jgi:large subunit ribosomal protein L5